MQLVLTPVLMANTGTSQNAITLELWYSGLRVLGECHGGTHWIRSKSPKKEDIQDCVMSCDVVRLFQSGTISDDMGDTFWTFPTHPSLDIRCVECYDFTVLVQLCW